MFSLIALVVSACVAVFWIHVKYSSQRSVDSLRRDMLDLLSKQDARMLASDVRMDALLKQMQDEFTTMHRRIQATETVRSTIRAPQQLSRPS